MIKITASDLIANEEELSQIELKKIMAQLLNVSEKTLFPLPEGKEFGVHVSVELRNISDRGTIF